MAYVYILKSLSKLITYTGSTVNLNKRLREHNKGLEKFTKLYTAWKLVYFEKYENISNTGKREKYFKTTDGRRYIKKNIIRE